MRPTRFSTEYRNIRLFTSRGLWTCAVRRRSAMHWRTWRTWCARSKTTARGSDLRARTVRGHRPATARWPTRPSVELPICWYYSFAVLRIRSTARQSAELPVLRTYTWFELPDWNWCEPVRPAFNLWTPSNARWKIWSSSEQLNRISRWTMLYIFRILTSRFSLRDSHLEALTSPIRASAALDAAPTLRCLQKAISIS